jgi:FdhD protein
VAADRSPVNPSSLAAAREALVERDEDDVRRDLVAIEEPLEIRVDGEALVVTMRSPGAEAELALGYLYAEGWIESAADVADVTVGAAAHADGKSATPGSDEPALVPGAIVDVRLSAEGRRRGSQSRNTGERERAFRVTSACGVCGKPSLEDLWVRLPAIRPLDLAPDREQRLVRKLPTAMRARQALFGDTGGVHGAALFEIDDGHAEQLWLYEDIGRHNAVDKVVGRALQAGRLPLHSTVLAVSGRLGFEIVQKAAVAGIPTLAAVGAPSSLALDIAHLAGIRVYAFVAGDRSNLYPPAPVEAHLVSRAD